MNEDARRTAALNKDAEARLMQTATDLTRLCVQYGSISGLTDKETIIDMFDEVLDHLRRQMRY